MEYTIKKIELPRLMSPLYFKALEASKKEAPVIVRFEINVQGGFSYTMVKQDEEIEKTLRFVQEKGFILGTMIMRTETGCVYKKIPVKPSARGFLDVLQSHLGSNFFIDPEK